MYVLTPPKNCLKQALEAAGACYNISGDKEMAKNNESVSFFFPAYYDKKSLPKLVSDFYKTLQKTGRDFEIIIIDDCSPDGTGAVANKLAKKFPKVRVIHNPKNLGYGGVLFAGFNSAKKDLVGFTDGDAQYSANDFGKFLEAIKDADFVIGYRMNRAEGVSRMIIQNGNKVALFLFFGMRFRDCDCGFKMIRKNVFKKVTPHSKGGFFSAEMIYRAKKNGLRIKEVPVTHLKRPFGKSTFLRWGKIFDFIEDMLKMRIGKL